MKHRQMHRCQDSSTLHRRLWPCVACGKHLCRACGYRCGVGFVHHVGSCESTLRAMAEGSMYRCTSSSCGWIGFNDDIITPILDDDDCLIVDATCPQCGGECEPMDDEEVQDWQHWQRQISQAHSELIRDWMQQPKPREKRPTRDEAEQRLRYHITH
jgi:hypothetical protein